MVAWWFDVEDFITPESDDPPKWIAEFFAGRQYKTTFKIVAEKIRALKERDRQDVINAIAEHDVGFHMNNHSIHPTIYEYLKNKTWQEGAREFERREAAGYKLVRETFQRVPSCFGHPGPAWAAECYPALAKWGIKTYLDETPILRLNDKPYWYCNILNIQGIGSNFIYLDRRFDESKGLRQVKKDYRKIYNRLRKTGPAVASILLHPHTLVTQKFWDSINFAQGRNRPRNQYEKPPPQPPAMISRLRKQFEEFVDYTASLPGSRLIDATDAAEIFLDEAKTRIFGLNDLLQLASKITRRVSFVKIDGFFLAASEALGLIASALAEYAETSRLPDDLRIIEILGPSKRVKTRGPRNLPTSKFLQGCVSVRNQIRDKRKVPDVIRIDSTFVSPADYLMASARLLRILLNKRNLPASVTIKKAILDSEKYLSPGDFYKAFRWDVLPTSFKAPDLIKHAKLQTWTLKPATSRNV